LYSSIDDLDLQLFKTDYLPKMISSKLLQSEKRDIKQQLAALNLYNMEQNCPTVAGILLIGKDPAHIMFGSYIQYVKFAGKTITSKILNERQFSGNILTVLKEIDYFIKYTIQTQRPVFVTVLREEMRINYPYEAIRELAMNLVMHRNYQTNAPARFYEYSDRIEMSNPGNLYGKVSPENFPNANDYRNPILAEAMKALGYVNRFGRGVSMVQEMLDENGNKQAAFDFKDISTFKVAVMSADPYTEDAISTAVNDAENGANGIGGTENGTENGVDGIENDTNGIGGTDEASELSSLEAAILSLVSKDKAMTKNCIAKALGTGTTTVSRYIEALKQRGIIERVGGSRGYWKINR
jgi:ATP-dependent DNA helicase RecG